MSLLLGIDLGTSYFKVGVFTPEGELRGLGREAVRVEHPRPDRWELPVDGFWVRLRAAVAAALSAAGVAADAIVGVSYSSQANTFVLLDAAGTALTPLILWPDRRAAPLPRDLVEFGRSPSYSTHTALTEVVPEQAPAKWRWFTAQNPDIWQRTRRALTLSDYLTLELTGEPVGDASTAALTGLYSLPERGWWHDAMARFGVAPTQLARPLVPGTVAGRTNTQAGARLGLRAGIPFAVGALDHHAAAIGAGVESLADASLSIGTVLAMIAFVERAAPGPGCIHGPHCDGRRFYRLAYDPDGAGQIEAYQRQFAPDLDVAGLLAAAEKNSTPHGPAVLAILRRIVTKQSDLLRTVAAGAAPIRRIAATGGGARSEFWLQLMADTLRVPIVTPAVSEPGCLGAAVFASVAAGVHRDVATAARAMVQLGREIGPRV